MNVGEDSMNRKKNIDLLLAVLGCSCCCCSRCCRKKRLCNLFIECIYETNETNKINKKHYEKRPDETANETTQSESRVMNESVIYIYHLYMHALMEDDLFLKPRSFIHCCFVLRRYEKE